MAAAIAAPVAQEMLDAVSEQSAPTQSLQRVHGGELRLSPERG
jgi:hypothetical protein